MDGLRQPPCRRACLTTLSPLSEEREIRRCTPCVLSTRALCRFRGRRGKASYRPTRPPLFFLSEGFALRSLPARCQSAGLINGTLTPTSGREGLAHPSSSLKSDGDLRRASYALGAMRSSSLSFSGATRQGILQAHPPALVSSFGGLRPPQPPGRGQRPAGLTNGWLTPASMPRSMPQRQPSPRRGGRPGAASYALDAISMRSRSGRNVRTPLSHLTGR